MDERGLVRTPQEAVSPLQMEALLRGVIHATNGQDQSKTVIPYHKALNGRQSALVVRRASNISQAFSVDIGVLDSDQTVLTSMAYADFIEQEGAINRRERAAVMHQEYPVANYTGIRVSRLELTPGDEAIRVDETVRRMSLGRGLISAARVLLHESGVPKLLIKNIRTGDGPGGKFYRSLGGAFIYEEISADVWGKSQLHTHMILPTAQSPKAPYVFGK